MPKKWTPKSRATELHGQRGNLRSTFKEGKSSDRRSVPFGKWEGYKESGPSISNSEGFQFKGCRDYYGK